ncbi:MAG: type II toxin-antitoxin system RelE/ParE family toxin [Bacteroidetes bacterium]|nr:type II toxin-antitoxin system RelE/ParE family toxin [Bacteroidota bacterium]
MQVIVDKQFIKDLDYITDKDILLRISNCIQSANTATSFMQLKGMKKITYKKNTSYYKIRMGNYRIGISYKNDVLIFERVAHRKDIYKFFPKH